MGFNYKPEIMTFSGKYFRFDDVENSDFNIVDIAHALSHTCRYTGHVKKFYSVAEHCVRASYIVPDEYALETLMHDASEAFLGDVSSPLKHMLTEYKMIEEYVEDEIMKKFGIPYPFNEWVKKADLIMLCTEKRDLMPNDNGPQWPVLKGVKALPETIEPWNSEFAKLAFLQRYEELT